MKNKNQIIIFLIPSHKGIAGNEKADVATMSSLELPITENTTTAEDFKAENKKKTQWNLEWENKQKKKSRHFQMDSNRNKERLSNHQGAKRTYMKTQLNILSHNASNAPNKDKNTTYHMNYSLVMFKVCPTQSFLKGSFALDTF